MDANLAPRTLVNNYWRKTCSCCGSGNISQLGLITYSSPILFSTVPIVTTHTPELWGCRKCQSKFTQNAIHEHDAVELYRAGNSGDRWKGIQFTEHQCSEVVQAVEQLLSPNNFIVDVGCNTGDFLDFALGKGCKTGGVEFSQASRAILENKGHTTYSSLSAVKNGSVDVITAYDLVEHLYHPAEFMSECHKKLRPGGRLFIVTGNANCIGARLSGGRWWYVNYPEHNVFPSKKYFLRHTQFRLERLFNTYAGRAYKYGLLKIVRRLIGGVLKGNYNASPSIGPDHMAVVLKRLD
jgi:SAM-dependent methyltransferase